MRSLPNHRTIPDGSPVYFFVTLDERGEHAFRVPRPSVVGRLLKPLIESGLWRRTKAEVGDVDDLSAELVEEAVGAAIGTCWRHRTLELETKRRDYDRGTDGRREYGGEGLGELHEAGYTQDEIAAILNQVVTRLMLAIPTPPQEVEELVGFTAPPKASETSAIST